MNQIQEVEEVEVVTISTKRSKLKKAVKDHPELKEWVNKDGPTAALVDWFLRENQSRLWLEDCLDQLDRDYIMDLDGNIRIKWNHLNSLLLSGLAMSDSIKEQFFRSFLYTGSRSIKKLAFDRSSFRGSVGFEPRFNGFNGFN